MFFLQPNYHTSTKFIKYTKPEKQQQKTVTPLDPQLAYQRERETETEREALNHKHQHHLKFTQQIAHNQHQHIN